ncbi:MULTISPECIES: CBS domain-containing protein [Nonomuraea]|uniref:CBS domain-containing protein n=1 Tax=Nonomuraea mangrovi TaxID=2316207 RepID=A0ABW4T147_9ACTN
MSIQVKDVMGAVAIAVVENASFADIVTAMRRYAVGAVTVIDADRRPVGVISEDDLILKEIDTVRHTVTIFESGRTRAEHKKAAATLAAELMTSPAITVTPDTPLKDAARTMHDSRIKQLPVIDLLTGRMIGTLHEADVLRVFTRPAEELEADIRQLAGDGFSITVDRGIVTIGGRVERASQAIALVERIRRLEGVVDVVSELACPGDDLAEAGRPDPRSAPTRRSSSVIRGR